MTAREMAEGLEYFVNAIDDGKDIHDFDLRLKLKDFLLAVKCHLTPSETGPMDAPLEAAFFPNTDTVALKWGQSELSAI